MQSKITFIGCLTTTQLSMIFNLRIGFICFQKDNKEFMEMPLTEIDVIQINIAAFTKKICGTTIYGKSFFR